MAGNAPTWRSARLPGTAALLALPLLLQTGCCAYSVSVSGYSRQCAVWTPRPAAPFHPRPDPPPLEELDLRWEPELGVYVVRGASCHFFRLRRHYRLRAGTWESAGSLEGPWSRVADDELPAGLRDGSGERFCRPSEGDVTRPARGSADAPGAP